MGTLIARPEKTKRPGLYLIALAGILAVGFPLNGVALFSAWECRLPFKISAAIQGTVTNQPLLVVLGEHLDGFRYDDFNSSHGHDLRFSDVGGMYELPYAVETWNPEGHSLIWVSLPEWGSHLDLVAYWSGETNAPAYTTNGVVWSDYRGVWHLAETNLVAGQTGGIHVDATSNHVSGTQYYNQPGEGIGGGIGQYLNGTSAYIDCGNPAAGQITNNLTLSLWVKPEILSGERGLLSKWSGGWCWTLNHGVNRLWFNDWHEASIAIETGQWSQVAAVYDATEQTIDLYVNGRLRGSHAQTSGPGSGGNLRIGHRGDGGPSLFQGWVDEARVAASTRASNYLYGAWMNIVSNEHFFTYGAVTSPVLRVAAMGIPDRYTNAVTLHGYLQGIGPGGSPDIYICWDPHGDQGTVSTGDWQNVRWIGDVWTTGESFSNVLTDTDLTTGQTYAYRWFATNTAGNAWSSESPPFGLGLLPAVSNRPPAWTRRSSAHLAGLLTEPDADPASVFLHYAVADGGPTNTLAIGTFAAAFSNIVGGLSPGVTYAFQWSASNTAGQTWSEPRVFETQPATPIAWYVAMSGDHTQGTNWTTAFNDIQTAVNEAGVKGDVIYLLGETNALLDAVRIIDHPGLTLLGGYEGLGDPGSTGTSATVLTRHPDLQNNEYRRLVEGIASTMTWERVTFSGGRFNHSGGGLRLDHCDTTLIKCTVRDQHWQNPYTTLYGGGLYALGGRLRVVDSVFRNNIMYGGWWHEHGYGAGMAARNADVLISNTVFNANRMQQRGGSCRGGGLYIENGTATVAQCVFEANWFSPHHAQLNIFDGAGLYARNVRSLTLHDSRFTGNGGSLGANAYNWFGNAIYLDGPHQSASIARIHIDDNRPPVAGAANSSAIHMHGGTASFYDLTLTNNAGSGIMLRNNARFSLVNGLIARNRGHGLSATTGSVVLTHATIADNHDPNVATFGLHRVDTPVTTGTNNIIYHNGSSRYLAEQINISDTRNVTLAYTCSYPLLHGIGNTDRSPEFRDRERADYRLRPGSAALDRGTNLTGVTHDLHGMPRPVDGDGSGVALSDMGAFEREHAESGSLSVNLAAWPYERTGASIFTPTFHVFATGLNTNLVWFEWDFTGDGEPDLEGADLWQVDWTFGGGWHDVALTVRNSAGESVTLIRPGYIRVVPDTVYVSLDGQHRHPFHTSAFAATNIQAAMGAVLSGGTVLFAPGEYLIAEQIPIMSPITLRGMDGWSNTTVRMIGSGRVFHLQHADGTIDGLTIRGGSAVSGMNIRIDAGSLINSRVTDNASGYNLTGPVFMTGGVVSNCLIIDNHAMHAGGVYLTGNALVTDSVIISNRAGVGWYSSGRGGGVYMQGGILQNSTVAGNENWFSRQFSDHSGLGGGIYLQDGTIKNVDIIGNDVTSRDGPQRHNGQGGGIYQTGGLIDRATLAFNIVSNASGGGIRKTGGILRNTLIAGNNGGGMNMSGGQTLNVTITRNWGGSFGGVTMSGGVITNSIITDNTTTNLLADPDIAGTVTNVAFTCTPALPHDPGGTGNITNAPGFINAGSGTGRNLTGGNFRLHHGSACIDTGLNQPWMTDALCRDAHPRIIKGWIHRAIPRHQHTVDRGAFEFLPPQKGIVLSIR